MEECSNISPVEGIELFASPLLFQPLLNTLADVSSNERSCAISELVITIVCSIG